MDHDQAVDWLNYRIASVPPQIAQTDDGRAYVAALRGIRDLLYVGKSSGRVVEQLAPLCPCDVNPDTTDGPQQECPIHGDGVTFVALCRWRDAVVGALARLVDAAEQVDSAAELTRAAPPPVADAVDELRAAVAHARQVLED